MASYPNCYNCKNVKLTMPFGELKCTKDGDHKVIRVEDEENNISEVGAVIGRRGALTACKDFKTRKGNIECEKDLQETFC